MFEGVNPNAITAAGVALVALSGIASTAGLGPGAVGIGGAILAGIIKIKKKCLTKNALKLFLNSTKIFKTLKNSVKLSLI